jgi:hypothetical protein
MFCAAMALLCAPLACSTKDDADTGSSSTAGAPSTDGPGTGSTGDASPTTGSESTGASSSEGGVQPGDETAGDPTTAAPTTGGDETTGGTTEPAPTDGPGVLPGESGLDAFCRRYVECGGTYYADAQACIDESEGYWGTCPSRKAALDAFGACMSEIECGDWSPDAYNPNSTPCAQQWSDLNASEPC